LVWASNPLLAFSNWKSMKWISDLLAMKTNTKHYSNIFYKKALLGKTFFCYLIKNFNQASHIMVSWKAVMGQKGNLIKMKKDFLCKKIILGFIWAYIQTAKIKVSFLSLILTKSTRVIILKLYNTILWNFKSQIWTS